MKKILVALFIFCQFSFFVKALDKLDKTDKTDIKSKSFYELEYDDIFFEMGSLLCNEAIPMIGMGVESKYEDSYTIYQNCFDLVCYKNIFDLDLMWTPTVFLGNPMIKIGTGIPLAIGIYEYIFNIGIGIRPSIKLTVANISFELFYQYLMKVLISCDAVKSNEFGLIIKIGTCTWLDDF